MNDGVMSFQEALLIQVEIRTPGSTPCLPFLRKRRDTLRRTHLYLADTECGVIPTCAALRGAGNKIGRSGNPEMQTVPIGLIGRVDQNLPPSCSEAERDRVRRPRPVCVSGKPRGSLLNFGGKSETGAWLENHPCL